VEGYNTTSCHRCLNPVYTCTI